MQIIDIFRSNKPCLRELYFSHFTNLYWEQANEEYNTPSTQPAKITSAFFIITSAKGYRMDHSSTQLVSIAHSPKLLLCYNSANIYHR